jgi:alkylation response protein AidB-like acyl-CoA dehydrogenase
MVQFELTPEQQQRKETVRRFAAEEIIPSPRSTTSSRPSPRTWRARRGRSGSWTFAVPEEFGGPGRSTYRRVGDESMPNRPESPERLIRHSELTSSTLRG